MEHHVFAVWDFMCLAKSLQGLIAPTSNPWLPQMEPNGVRLINEIILAEESDILPDGTYLSHFELYIKAMKDVGANTRPILGFLDKVKNDGVPNALQSQYISPIAKRFMSLTFEQIATNCPWIVCASFTHGREAIVPLKGMRLWQQYYLIVFVKGPKKELRKLRWQLSLQLRPGYGFGLKFMTF